ncbi:MAG: YqgE/AlgH family protein [Rhodospirillales bacterium]
MDRFDDDFDAMDEDGYLTGQLLIAMPGMDDERFAQSVIYICGHNSEGAMGLVVNRVLDSITFPDLLEQLEITPPGIAEPISVHFGGPVEAGRGFVLHTAEYAQETTTMVNSRVALTATVDILRDMARGRGPRQSLLALGYAGWGPGQLDQEIKDNGWLNVQADEDLLFDHDLESKWERAITKIGVDPRMLTGVAGHA